MSMDDIKRMGDNMQGCRLCKKLSPMRIDSAVREPFPPPRRSACHLPAKRICSACACPAIRRREPRLRRRIAAWFLLSPITQEHTFRCAVVKAINYASGGIAPKTLFTRYRFLGIGSRSCPAEHLAEKNALPSFPSRASRVAIRSFRNVWNFMGTLQLGLAHGLPSARVGNLQFPSPILMTTPAAISSTGFVILRHPPQVHLYGGKRPLHVGIHPPTSTAPCLIRRCASEPDRAILS
jgi:hypothetical protein